jgi:hypothetical protein
VRPESCAPPRSAGPPVRGAPQRSAREMAHAPARPTVRRAERPNHGQLGTFGRLETPNFSASALPPPPPPPPPPPRPVSAADPAPASRRCAAAVGAAMARGPARPSAPRRGATNHGSWELSEAWRRLTFPALASAPPRPPHPPRPPPRHGPRTRLGLRAPPRPPGPARPPPATAAVSATGRRRPRPPSPPRAAACPDRQTTERHRFRPRRAAPAREDGGRGAPVRERARVHADLVRSAACATL